MQNFFGWCELGFRELQSEGKISVISDSQINSQIAFPFPVIPMSQFSYIILNSPLFNTLPQIPPLIKFPLSLSKKHIFHRSFIFLYSFFSLNSAPSFLPVQLNGRFYKRKSCNSLLCNGDETQKSWKPLLNMISALRGSSEWFAQWNWRTFFCKIDHTTFI